MEPHTSSYLSKYFVKLFRLHTQRRLAFTLAWCMLEYSSNKVCYGTKTLSHPWRPYKVARSRSPCTRKSWLVSVLVSRVVSTELFSPVCTFPAKSSLVRENLSSQYPIFTRFSIFNESIPEKQGKLWEFMQRVDNTRSSQMPSLLRFPFFFLVNSREQGCIPAVSCIKLKFPEHA